MLLQSQELTQLEQKVTDFTLNNGLRFIVFERHEVPTISFHTYVKAGSVDNPAGYSGLAHIFEHLAHKGSETIGTRGWENEKKALEAMDEAYDRMEAERNKGGRADRNKLENLQTQVRLAIDVAGRNAQPKEYDDILGESGAGGSRASAGWNSIEYAYTLPSNRAELWYLMEAQRLFHPVFREFYTEREGMLEEYQKSQQSVQNRLLDALLNTAFAAHPYHTPAIGWPSDISNLKRSDAKAFYDKYFVPGNITVAMAGDVNPAEARRMAEKYFGGTTARPLPPILHTDELTQHGPRTVVLELSTQPVAAIGYKRPSYYDKDDAVLDVLQLLLTNGKDGLLYRDLVLEKRLAQAADSVATFPDGRYPNLFLFVIVPSGVHTVDEIQKAMDEVFGSLKLRPIDAGLLYQAKNQVRFRSYQKLTSNAVMANMLATYAVEFGDCRKLFTSLEDVDKISAEDVMRVAQKYFVASTRTTVYVAAPGLPPGSQSRIGDRQ
jgi:predicted Zn-dependent peptidase